jgi:hypothetical protein
MVIEVRFFGEALTVTDVVAPTVPTLAVAVAVPGAIAFSSPLALTVATAALEDAQVAELVTSVWLPSLYVPVAVNCWAALTLSDTLTGASVSEVKVLLLLGGGVLVAALLADELPHPTVISRFKKVTESSQKIALRNSIQILQNSHSAA